SLVNLLIFQRIISLTMPDKINIHGCFMKSLHTYHPLLYYRKYIIFFSFFAIFVNPFQNLLYVQICKVCCVDVENSIILRDFKPVGVPKSLIFIVFFCIIYLNSLNKKRAL